ncbi:hypothetical protein BC332_33774 [Capsicum chinense]|nr:hypothetical protein BC332_33774 [Capsicum chinense]
MSKNFFKNLPPKEKKEAEIKQLRRNLNFKATLMPSFYREPGCRSEKTRMDRAGRRPSTAVGARVTSATENTVRCLRAEFYNRCSTNERLNAADSPQVLEVTIHPSAELSESSMPSASISKTSKQTQPNRTVALKREQEKRQVANSPRPKTSAFIRRNKDFKAEDKTKADSWQSGSISFGRFENEALCWERRSSFTHNRYLEEVEKYFKPGSVTEKKAYFEEIFRRRALLSQSSFDCQDGADSQASNVGSENTDYEGHFEHVNEIGHSTCFVENHDRAATLLENGKYQASENEGYAGRFEHVNEVVHSACFDENYDRSTHLSKNGKYQAENTGYNGDSERVNEVGDSVRFEESFDGSNNRDIKVTEYTNSFDVLQSVPELLEAEAKFNLSAGNSAFNDPEFFMKIEEKVHAKEEETRQLQARTQEKKEAEIKQLWRNLNFKETPMPAFYREPDHRSEKNQGNIKSVHLAYCSHMKITCFIQISSGSKANVLNQHKRKRKKQRSNSYGEISISKKLSCLLFTVNLATAQKKTRMDRAGRTQEQELQSEELASKTKSQSRPSTAARARATSATENTVRCLRAEVYNRCSTNERLNVADSPQVSEVTIHPLADLSDSSVPSAATSKMSKQTQSIRTVAPKREQEKTQVANSTRPRTSDSIRRNKEFKAEDKTKVLARRTGNHATRKDVRSVDLSHSTRVGHLAVGVAS